VDTADSAKVELETLIGLFFSETSELGRFEETKADAMPEPFRSLLAHDFHMTVTVEKFHSSPVDVRVLHSRKDERLYSRKILLTRQSDDQVVQYGIVRLNFDVLEDQVVKEIESESTPLGRILINHNVLRRVKLLSLYSVECDQELADSLGVSKGETVFGRTALIYLNEKPAIELLEIVSV
jgi:chorismate-pyruvate lyase